jgi:Flp pilus assembly protein TadG
VSGRRNRGRDRGQAMAEFAIAIPVFLMMLLGVFDLGRAVYTYNGLAEAAREIARATSVHLGSPVGTSQQTVDVISTQRSLVPGLAVDATSFECFDLTDTTDATPVTCASGAYVKVVVTSVFSPVSPFGVLGPVNLSSASSVQVP